MKEIYIYSTLKAWLSEKPDATLKGKVVSHDGSVIEILDENNYTQLINVEAIFAVVF